MSEKSVKEKAFDLNEQNKLMKEAILEMDWFVDHIMGKEKRVNWGNTFDINWGRVNNALIKLTAVTASIKKENEND